MIAIVRNAKFALRLFDYTIDENFKVRY